MTTIYIINHNDLAVRVKMEADKNFSFDLVPLDAFQRERWSLALSADLNTVLQVVSNPDTRKMMRDMHATFLSLLDRSTSRQMYLAMFKNNDVPWVIARLYDVPSTFSKYAPPEPAIDGVCLLLPTVAQRFGRLDEIFPVFLSLLVNKLRVDRVISSLIIVSPPSYINDALVDLEEKYEDWVMVSRNDDNINVEILDDESFSNIWKEASSHRTKSAVVVPLEEEHRVSEHLIHTFIRVSDSNKNTWISFFREEIPKWHYIEKEPVQEAVREVMDVMRNALIMHNDEDDGDQHYLSILKYDNIPWMIMFAHFDRTRPGLMFIQFVSRTPSSYQYAQTHCTDGKNLLPTLLSLTSQQMSKIASFSEVVVIQPFQVTFEILRQLSFSTLGTFDLIVDTPDLRLEIHDLDAFNSMWKTRKHCAEPIAGLCGGCLQVAYCSKECAAENWTFHRHECPRNK